MCRDISREDSVLVWQCIDFRFLVRYVEVLKSRIYKAFLLKQKNYKQLAWLNSSLVILFFTEKALLPTALGLNSFEVGYLIFCLHKAIDIDTNFFSCYRQVLDMQLTSKLQDCIDQVKYSMISSLIKIYKMYLLHSNKVLGYQFYSLNTILSIPDVLSIPEYVFQLDTRYFLSSLNSFVLLAKLDLLKSVKIYLLKFLDWKSINIMPAISDVSLNLVSFTKNRNDLVYDLLNLCVLQLLYEILFAIDTLCFNVSSSGKNLILIYNSLHLMLLSSNSSFLRIWRNKLSFFLSFYGIEYQYIKNIPLFRLSRGIYLGPVFISANGQFNPFYLVITPSLCLQFALMHRVSLLLSRFKAKPLFIAIIRFNMLILSWLNYFVIQHSLKKVFCFLDYLIVLKFNFLLKDRGLSLNNSKIKIFNSFTEDSISVCQRFEPFMINLVSNSKYYKYYIPTKMVYLLRLRSRKQA